MNRICICNRRGVAQTLKRRLRLVVLLNRKAPAKPRFIVLGSTDPISMVANLWNDTPRVSRSSFSSVTVNSSPGSLTVRHVAASALDFHFNAALATLNLVRAADMGMQQGQEPQSSRWPAGSSVNATNDCSMYV